MRSEPPRPTKDPYGYRQWTSKGDAIGAKLLGDSDTFTNLLVSIRLTDPTRRASVEGINTYYHVAGEDERFVKRGIAAYKFFPGRVDCADVAPSTG